MKDGHDRSRFQGPSEPARLRVFCYGADAVANVIVSDESIKSLIEAHASMAAWYYQMADALRAAGAHATPPSEAQRQAYVAQLAHHFPELSAVAKAITHPRPYIPPPAIPAPATVVENEGIMIPEAPTGHIATPERVAGPEPAPPAAPPPPAPPEHPDSAPPLSTGAPPPPPLIVDPTKVKYED